MTAFTRHLTDLGLTLPAAAELEDSLEKSAPGLEYALAAQAEPSDAFPAQGTLLLVPADESPAAREALESLLAQRLIQDSPALVLDLDISAPHDQLLGESGREGLSDHFLYGVSRDKLLGESRDFPRMGVIPPGTYTPRAADIYRDRKWPGLLDWLGGLGRGLLVLIAPPLSRYRDLAFLPAVNSVLLFAGDDPAAAAGLAENLSVLKARLPESAGLRLLWSGETAAVPETPYEPEAVGTAEVEPESEPAAETPSLDEAVLPGEESLDFSDLELPVEEPPAAEETPLEELSLDDLTPPEEPAAETPTLDEAVLPGEESLDFSDLELPVEEPPAAEETPLEELSLDDLTPSEEPAAETPALDETSLPGEESLDFSDLELPGEESSAAESETPLEELSLDDLTPPEEPAAETPALDEANLPGEESLDFSDLELPGEEPPAAESETPLEELSADDLPPLEELEPAEPAASRGAPDKKTAAGEDEDEIFLPRELLFLDEEDERRGAGAEGKSFEQELNDLSRGELPDLQPEPHLPKAAEPARPKKAETPQFQDELGEEEIEPDSGKAMPPEEPQTQKEPDLDDALFTDAGAELEEEQPAPAPRKAAPVLDPEQAAKALEKIEGFEETLSAPEEPAEELHLDIDPLDQGEPETIELEPEPEPELTAEPEPLDLEELPVEQLEAGQEEMSLPGEEEPVEALEEEDIQPLEEEALEELEPAELEAAGLPGDEGAGMEAELELPAESGPVDQTVAPLDEGDIEDLEMELDQANKAAGPAKLVELDDEGVPQAASAAGGDGLPDMDSLLSDDDGLGELDTSIDLGGTGLANVQAKPAKTVRKKGKKKKSAARTLVWSTLLMLMIGGMFVLWRQGTVSQFLRQSPLLSQLAGKIGMTIPGLKVLEEAVETPAPADSVAQAAPVEPPPQLQNYEYSIQVGSYRYLPQALEAREKLAQAGLQDVYVAPVILDSLGSWNRLYVGYFASSAQADTVLARILPELRKVATADNEPGLAIRRRTPWAISLGDFGPADSLEAFRSRLAGYDIPSYAVQISADSSGNKKFRLYVGAFEDQDQAVLIRSRLFDVGVKGAIEEREGPAEAEPVKPQGQV